MRRGETARGGGGWATHVAVTAKVLEQLDLAQGALGENLLAKDICNLLDGDALVGLVVDGSAASPDEAGLSSAKCGGVEEGEKEIEGSSGSTRDEEQLTRRYHRRPVQAPW